MGRSRVEIYVHATWATRGREPLLTEGIERAVYGCVHQEVQTLGCTLIAVGGTADHVHLAVKMATNVSLAQLIKQVKGVSARFGNAEFGTGKAGSLSFFGWQEGYGAFSVSHTHLEKVKSYIKNQKTHHAEGNICQEWEPDPL